MIQNCGQRWSSYHHNNKKLLLLRYNLLSIYYPSCFAKHFCCRAWHQWRQPLFYKQLSVMSMRLPTLLIVRVPKKIHGAIMHRPPLLAPERTLAMAVQHHVIVIPAQQQVPPVPAVMGHHLDHHLDHHHLLLLDHPLNQAHGANTHPIVKQMKFVACAIVTMVMQHWVTLVATVNPMVKQNQIHSNPIVAVVSLV